MRTVPIGSVAGIVFARVLLGMSEIAQQALAIPPMVPTKSVGASKIRGKPFELAPPGPASARLLHMATSFMVSLRHLPRTTGSYVLHDLHRSL